MNLINIDKTKCKLDGICAMECPAGLIQIKDGDKVPTTVDFAEEVCINCGHCVAVCPHGALSHRIMSSENCQLIHNELMPSKEQGEQFLKMRRSIRIYKDKEVDRETLGKVIKIAGYAPSGHNEQPVKWLIISGKEEVKRFSGLVIDWMRAMIKEKSPMARALNMTALVRVWRSGYDPICRHAPYIIVAYAHKEDMAASSACTIALTYLELAALSQGLGTCWAGFLQFAATSWPDLIKALDLPKGHSCFGAMMLGYPKFNYHRIPLRKESDIIWR